MIKTLETTGRPKRLPFRAPWTSWVWTRDSVSVEILERAKKGFLGIGGTLAKVKVTYEVPDPVEPVKAAPAAPPVVETPAPAVEEAPAPAAPVEEAPVVKEEVRPEPEAPVEEAPAGEAPAAEEIPEAPADLEGRIRAFLSGLLEHMGIEAEINVGPKTENGILVTLEGPKLGGLIGRRGETLDAIQQLTNYSVNRGQPSGCASTSTRRTTGPSGRSPSSGWPARPPGRR